ncbi:unnamed protein product [Rhizophagus irregularis]|uniref:mannose-1-phosphate guanylyltransferase n=1 Tax=Rhizophagus irregularis TaxID=588596 RepID=A0A915ZU87_9GLOM|nr:mannose-1-phosphate guanyltransferase [Rhizophagus irregularis DAOM 181602=DAOM 197198]CAB4377195.1 unnamed protein product [Rhizophagus irregularis]CAB5102488.1 unnamed protein product [Rhizophagus irregularis]CAB5383259.1 unnamed protein product [Rhizophagus irregularis]CAB5391195.1 unnamed protein product [Rhizophagus irregularis]
MKALILVGGYGTRLRPLTLTLPKPLVEFCNKPMILHQIEGLVKAGVTDIVLAVNYRPEIMISLLQKYEKEYNVKITFSVETEPLGTAGPLALAREILGKDDSPFFVLNSDIICEFPFEQLRDFHNAHGNEGTIVVTKVDEPSKYGVIVNHHDSTCIQRFVEKPVEFVSNKINAGIYIFNPTILDRIELKPTSIEKEIFPKMAADSQLHAFELDGFWMDVGQPKDFLTGTCLYLSNLANKQPNLLAKPDSGYIYGDVLVDPTAKIEGARVKDFAWVKNSIVGWHSTLGRWTRLEGVSVLGDDVTVNEEIYVNGGCILPHKSISTNITEPQIIM